MAIYVNEHKQRHVSKCYADARAINLDTVNVAKVTHCSKQTFAALPH